MGGFALNGIGLFRAWGGAGSALLCFSFGLEFLSLFLVGSGRSSM